MSDSGDDGLILRKNAALTTAAAWIEGIWENVNVTVFEQILEMDDDSDREFSKSIVVGFLEQAENTFTSMDAYLESKNLSQLSNLGHFLKGSSATLGFTRIQDECEKIQHYGQQKDATGTEEEPNQELCLSLIRASLSIAKNAFVSVKALMVKFYDLD